MEHIDPDERMTFAYLDKDEVLFCVVGLSGRNGGNAKQIGSCLDMIESMTWRSRPDFRAVALLWTAHRSFGRSAFKLQRGQVKRGTSEPRNLHWNSMQRSSKGSSQDNSSFRFRKRLWIFPGPSLSNDIIPFPGRAVTMRPALESLARVRRTKL